MPKHEPIITPKNFMLEYLRGNWGSRRPFEDIVHDKDMYLILISGCLLYFIDLVENGIAGVREKAAETGRWEHRDRIRTSIEHFIAEREAKHGPCPEPVMHAIYQEMGERYLRYENTYIQYLSPPGRKGTVVRKQYTAWMKRKAKTAS